MLFFFILTCSLVPYLCLWMFHYFIGIFLPLAKGFMIIKVKSQCLFFLKFSVSTVVFFDVQCLGRTKKKFFWDVHCLSQLKKFFWDVLCLSQIKNFFGMFTDSAGQKKIFFPVSAGQIFFSDVHCLSQIKKIFWDVHCLGWTNFFFRRSLS